MVERRELPGWLLPDARKSLGRQRGALSGSRGGFGEMREAQRCARTRRRRHALGFSVHAPGFVVHALSSVTHVLGSGSHAVSFGGYGVMSGTTH